MKKLWWGLLFVLVGGAGVFLLLPKSENQNFLPAKLLPAALRPAVPPPKAFQEKQAVLPPLEGVDGKFLQFVLDEAPKIDSLNVNAEEADRRARAQVDSLGERELEFLGKMVNSEGATGPQKIYSVYLLDLAGERAWGSLREVALAPLKERMAAPHTMEEVKSMQEKAFVYMAVDALAEQAETNPKAVEELERWAAEARNPEVRAYILQKLKELPSASR
jgi:hypothetical protein